MNAPEGFAEEFEQIRQGVEWGLATLGSDNHLAQDKIFVAGFRAFYRKWRLLIDPELRAPLEILHRKLEADFAPKMEALYWTSLNLVLAARATWLVSEELFRATIPVAVYLRDLPGETRAKMIAASANPAGTSALLSGERAYREAEETVIEAETVLRKDLAHLEADWPERVDAAFRERLDKADGAGIMLWQAEIAVELEKLSKILELSR